MVVNEDNSVSRGDNSTGPHSGPGYTARTDDSVGTAIADSGREITRRAHFLTGQEELPDNRLLQIYASMANDMGYGRMKQMGTEILQQGGTFPSVRFLGLKRNRDEYAIEVLETSTGRHFTFPCQDTIRQYDGALIRVDGLGALDDYLGKEITLDLSRNGKVYEAVLIGTAEQVLGDSPQAIRLDTILS